MQAIFTFELFMTLKMTPNISALSTGNLNTETINSLHSTKDGNVKNKKISKDYELLDPECEINTSLIRINNESKALANRHPDI